MAAIKYYCKKDKGYHYLGSEAYRNHMGFAKTGRKKSPKRTRTRKLKVGLY